MLGCGELVVDVAGCPGAGGSVAPVDVGRGQTHHGHVDSGGIHSLDAGVPVVELRAEGADFRPTVDERIAPGSGFDMCVLVTRGLQGYQPVSSIHVGVDVDDLRLPGSLDRRHPLRCLIRPVRALARVRSSQRRCGIGGSYGGDRNRSQCA